MKKTDNLIDANLVIAYQNGDKEVSKQLVKRWHVQFCRFAFWICKDADLAKDIAQESWVVIFKKLPELNDPKKFKSWSISIVNRKTIDWIRASKREHNKLTTFYNDHSEETEAVERNEESKLIVVLREELQKLPENQKMVIQLFYMDNYSLKQIGELLTISVGTAKSRLFHAREKLKLVVKK